MPDVLGFQEKFTNSGMLESPGNKVCVTAYVFYAFMRFFAGTGIVAVRPWVCLFHSFFIDCRSEIYLCDLRGSQHKKRESKKGKLLARDPTSLFDPNDSLTVLLMLPTAYTNIC